MSTARYVRKNLNLFVDGKGYAGQINDFNAPKLTIKTEEFRGGGMQGPLDLTMGHDTLKTDFSLIAYDPDVLLLIGVVEGFDVQFTAREALEDIDSSVTPVFHSMRGKITEIDPGTSQAGEKTSLKVSLSLNYYKLTHGDQIVQEWDVENMVYKVNGVDTTAALRRAIGI